MLGACSAATGSITEIIYFIACLVGMVIPLAFAVALFAFFWKVFQGFGKADEVDKRSEMRQALVWAILALFVIITLSGIIALFGATFPDLQAAK